MEEIRCLLWLLMVFGTASPKIWTVLHHWKTPQKACEACGIRPAPASRGCRPMLSGGCIRFMRHRWTRCWHGARSRRSRFCGMASRNIRRNFCHCESAGAALLSGGSLRAARDALPDGGGNPSSVGVQPQRCVEAVPGSGAAGLCDGHGICVGIDIIAKPLCAGGGKAQRRLMGCGLDIAYPQQHFELKERITANGLILSEFLPGTPPSPANFPIRNRVLSGLTMGTLVIQAPQRSGTLITRRTPWSRDGMSFVCRRQTYLTNSIRV